MVRNGSFAFQGFTFISGRVPVEGFVWRSLSAMVYFEMGTMGRLVYVAYPLESKSGSLEKARLTCLCVVVFKCCIQELRDKLEAWTNYTSSIKPFPWHPLLGKYQGKRQAA